MSAYHYVIAYPDGSYLDLTSDGPQEVSQEVLDQLRKEDFHHDESRPLGDEATLQVYHRKTPATDIVPPDGMPVHETAGR